MTSNEFRIWLRRMVEAIQAAAEITNTTIDDQACEMALKVIDSDTLWSWAWKLIGRWLEGEDDPILVSAEDAPEVGALINPLTVIALIRALVEVWKIIRPQS